MGFRLAGDALSRSENLVVPKAQRHARLWRNVEVKMNTIAKVRFHSQVTCWAFHDYEYDRTAVPMCFPQTKMEWEEYRMVVEAGRNKRFLEPNSNLRKEYLPSPVEAFRQKSFRRRSI